MKSIKTDQKQRNILIIDNDKALILDIKEHIDQEEIKDRLGMNFMFASDAKTALKKLESATVDLVILEIVLPVINGYYLLELLKKSYPNIPVMIYTRLKNPQDLAKMANYEVHNIFIKDLMRPEDLITIACSKNLAKEDIDHVVMELKSQMKSISESEVGKQLKLVQCPKCNLIIAPDSHYCNNCGQKIATKIKKSLKSSADENAKETEAKKTSELEAEEKKK